MKIAIVSNTSWSIYNFRLNLIRALQEQGHEIVAIGSIDAHVRRLRSAGVRAIGIPFTGKSKRPSRELRTIIALRRQLRRHSPEIVLSFTPKGNLYVAFSAWGLPIRQIANVSGLGRVFVHENLLTRFVRWLYRIAFRRARHVFFQNDDDRAFFIERKLVDPARIDRLPGSGVDLAQFIAVPFQGRAPGVVFLMFGRLLWEKGISEFIEAARQLKLEFPSARFQLMGTSARLVEIGPTQAQLKAWVKEGVIEYLGWMDDVRPAVAAADCVVLPTAYREGVPRSLLEAAAMARPVIASDAPGSRDAIEDGLTGLLCKPRNVQNLIATIRRFMLLGPEMWAAMGAEGRRMMERDFDERFVIQRYLQVIDRVARERPAP